MLFFAWINIVPFPVIADRLFSFRSFSDWTIRVQFNAIQEGSVDIYHVHRNILAIGRRRSGYFANLFHYGIDDGNHCTNLELNERAASSFPDLLDYLYASKAFAVVTANAVALLFLSQAFQITSLQEYVEQFIESDIGFANFGCYLSDALYYSDEAMAMKVIDKCGNEVLQFCGNHQHLTRILRTLLSSTATKAQEKVQETWSFLTGASKALSTPAISGLTRRTLQWRDRVKGKADDGL